MSSTAPEVDIDELRASRARLGAKVRELKKAGNTDPTVLSNAIKELNVAQKALAEAEELIKVQL